MPLRRPRILGLREGVGIILPECVLDIFLTVYVDWMSLDEVERAYVIQPACMILMVVCQQYGVQVPDILTEHLVAEVRAGVDQYRQAAVFDQRG